MYCTKCGAITTNRLARKCPRPGCDGKMKPNTKGSQYRYARRRPLAL